MIRLDIIDVSDVDDKCKMIAGATDMIRLNITDASNVENKCKVIAGASDEAVVGPPLE